MVSALNGVVSGKGTEVTVSMAPRLSAMAKSIARHVLSWVLGLVKGLTEE